MNQTNTHSLAFYMKIQQSTTLDIQSIHLLWLKCSSSHNYSAQCSKLSSHWARSYINEESTIKYFSPSPSMEQNLNQEFQILQHFQSQLEFLSNNVKPRYTRVYISCTSTKINKQKSMQHVKFHFLLHGSQSNYCNQQIKNVQQVKFQYLLHGSLIFMVINK